MQAVRSIDPRIPIRDRLSMRLALLFVGTFLVILILLMAWTMFATIGDRAQAAAGSGVAAPVIVIDPKIQTDLAKALAFDGLPTGGEVLNPFLDRAGLGGNAATATGTRTAAQSPSTSAAGTTTTTVTGSAGTTPAGRTTRTGWSPASSARKPAKRAAARRRRSTT